MANSGTSLKQLWVVGPAREDPDRKEPDRDVADREKESREEARENNPEFEDAGMQKSTK